MSEVASRDRDAVDAGYRAFASGAWAEARERFEAALEEGDSGAAWEGLGWAGWWLGDQELTLRARERAYRAYRAAGDRAAAGGVAAWLAADYEEYAGNETVARGWLERAQRMLEGLPESPAQGWLALHEGHFALGRCDTAQALRSARTASALGRRLGDADLEAIGLAQEGVALVVSGEVAEGTRRLDEASVTAVSEDVKLPASLGWTVCYLISACAGIGDFPRATHWCETMQAFAERWGARSFMGVCRTSYGAVLSTAGHWREAEVELQAAAEDFEAARPAMVAGSLVRLGELRARQGRVDEARALFEQAGADEAGLLGLGELALDAGDADTAADAAERVLRRLPEASLLDRLPALELLVRARIALVQLDVAAAVAAELERAATLLGTPYLRGRARLVLGELSAARGDEEEARRAAEDAVDCFVQSDAPYEAALARLVLAAALAALGRAAPSAAQARAAREAFASLGAVRDVDRADAFLAGPRTGEGVLLGELTAREVEVLRLVAQGLSDTEIADRLVVSPHTVHRHVANVRAKLRLPSRAAAVAYAARAGLL